jgi:hypothetical protein
MFNGFGRGLARFSTERPAELAWAEARDVG